MQLEVSITRMTYFFAKFQGFNNEVIFQFENGFNDKVAHVGDLIITMNERTTSQVTEFPLGVK